MVIQFCARKSLIDLFGNKILSQKELFAQNAAEIVADFAENAQKCAFPLVNYEELKGNRAIGAGLGNRKLQKIVNEVRQAGAEEQRDIVDRQLAMKYKKADYRENNELRAVGNDHKSN